MDATIYFGQGYMSRVAGSGDEMWRCVSEASPSTFVRFTNDSNENKANIMSRKLYSNVPSRRQAETLFEASIIFDGCSELEARNVEGTFHYLFHDLPIGIPIHNRTGFSASRLWTIPDKGSRIGTGTYQLFVLIGVGLATNPSIVQKSKTPTETADNAYKRRLKKEEELKTVVPLSVKAEDLVMADILLPLTKLIGTGDVVITGCIHGYDKSAIKEAIDKLQFGGILRSDITRATTLLICGNQPTLDAGTLSSKEKRAAIRKIPVMDSIDFMTKLAELTAVSIQPERARRFVSTENGECMFVDQAKN